VITPVPLLCGCALSGWRLSRRLPRLFRFRRDLAELLLLANRCRKERLVVVASVFHWRLFHRRGADVQHRATLTQRNSRYGLMSAMPLSGHPQLRRACLLLTQSGHRTRTFATSVITYRNATVARARLTLSPGQMVTGPGAAPDRAILVPWPGRFRICTPAAFDTRTAPSIKNTPSA
jgi:hypothetical protein